MLRLRGALFLVAVVPVFVAALLRAGFVAEDFERDADDRVFAEELVREAFPREVLAVDRLDFAEPPLLVDAPASIDHLPLITRFAASATASAISEPSFVALDNTDLAALSAVSAASIPASRMALRAFGLALIAAAAAARPAASISLLIAALVSFSAVDLEDPEERAPAPETLELVLAVFERAPEDLDPVLLLDFAIANLLRSSR